MANQILEVRQNIYYKKETSEGEYKKFHELIFIVDKPSYSRTTELSNHKRERRFHLFTSLTPNP